MALRRLPYKRLQSLIGTHLSTREDADTQTLIVEFSETRKRGYLRKAELLKACRWKSARAIRHVRKNREDAVKSVTEKAFRTRSEILKLEYLTSLSGVSVPMASSILMLTNPRRYGVIDIRVWQLLHSMGAVTGNEKGIGFGLKHWYPYLMLLRFYAKKYKVKARDIERTLFNVHRLYQRGTLYRQ